jgi:hypothetical protein
MLSGKQGAGNMATAPSAEESARRILRIFLDHDQRAGDVLQQNTFIDPFAQPGWKTSDYNAGIAYAVAQGWLEPVTLGSHRLTSDGFAEAK